MKKLDDMPLPLSLMRGKDKEKNQQEFGNFLLGVESTKDLKKIDGYRFFDGENSYYLYHGKRSQMGEDIWVMARSIHKVR